MTPIPNGPAANPRTTSSVLKLGPVDIAALQAAVGQHDAVETPLLELQRLVV